MILQVVIRWTRCLTLCLCSVASATVAEREALDDLTARIQFDYYAADARALQRDLQALKQLDATDSTAILRQYYLAFGHMRLAETLGDKDRSAARKAASTCVDLADDVVDTEPKRSTPRERARLDILYAELWAIQGACGSLEATLSLLPETTLSSNKARKNAAALAPDNPRVQLLAAIHEAKRANTAEEIEHAKNKLIAVVNLFDGLPPVESDLPDWGQAEALAWLGQNQIRRGDKVAARNTLERALVIAPDYVWARTLQTQLKGSR